MADREKVIKGLECAIGIRGRKNCDSCPYDNDFNCLGCDIVIRDALELLKEQKAVVHCGDCENFCFDNISPNAGRCMLTNISHSKTWFCAHGKREESR